MRNILLPVLTAMMAYAAGAADSTQKIAEAAKQVSDKPNYSWTTMTKEGDGSPGKLGPIQGKADKNGVTMLDFVVGGIPVEVCMKDKKGSAKALEGWQTFDEIAKTSGTAAAVVRYLRSYKTPAAESATAKELLLFGVRQREGEEPPKTSEAKGSIKFWVKDGALTRYEIKVQGKVSAGDRENEIDRTTTVEIKDAGTTKMEVPAEAMEKMS